MKIRNSKYIAIFSIWTLFQFFGFLGLASDNYNISESNTKDIETSGSEHYFEIPNKIIGPDSIQRRNLVFLSGVPKEIQELVLKDLEFVKSLKGKHATSLHRKFYGGINGINYLNFFLNRIGKIDFDSSMPHSSLAAFNTLTGNLTIGTGIMRSRVSQIGRIAIYFHEARHADSIAPDHMACPMPFVDFRTKREVLSVFNGRPLAGKPASCDYAVEGAYGYSAILMKNIALFCDSCSKEVKDEAMLWYRDGLSRMFTDFAYDEIAKDGD